MNIVEVEKKLGDLGVRIPRGTLLRWSASRLIPSPRGRANAQWSPWAPAIAATADFLIHREGWSQAEVANWAQQLTAHLESGTICAALQDIGEEGRARRRAFEWSIMTLKFHLGLPADKAATVVLVYPIRDGKGSYKAEKAARIDLTGLSASEVKRIAREYGVRAPGRKVRRVLAGLYEVDRLIG